MNHPFLCRTRRLRLGIWLVGAGCAVTGAALPVCAEDAASVLSVQDNVRVGIDYTLTVDGEAVESTQGKAPFHYIQGRHEVIVGLERQLAGLKVGETKAVTVSPEDGYGAVDPSAVVEIPKTQLPSDVTPEVGIVLRGVNPDGNSFRAKIVALKQDSVVLDLNHPLAGKTLTFQVTITDLAPAVPEEPPLASPGAR